MDREQLVSSLQRRVSCYTDGDPAPVLEPEAHTETERLLTFLGTPDGVDFNVLHLAGLVYLLRAAALYERRSPDAAVTERLAFVLLTPVYLAHPDAVDEEVGKAIRPALNLSPPEAGHAGWAQDLGLALAAVAELTGDLAAFRDAIAMLTDAVTEAAANSDARRSGYLAALGVTMRVLYERHGAAPVLANALGVLAEAVRTAEPGDPGLPQWTAELGFTLRLDFERTGDRAKLAEAIETGRRACELCPAEAPERADILSYLGGALAAGAGQGDPTADEAVEVGAEAVRLSTSDDPQRPARLVNYSLALLARQHQTGDLTGDPADARLAAEAVQEAIAATDPGDPTLPSMRSSLGYALLLRDRDDIDDETLNRAISAFEQAAAGISPEQQAAYARCQGGLGTALRLRWHRTEDPETQDGAIAALRAAVDAATDRESLRENWAADLTELLGDRAVRQRTPESVDEAIEAVRRLADRQRDAELPDTERAKTWMRLSSLYRARYMRYGHGGADLGAAVEAARRGIACTEVEPAVRVRYLVDLVDLLCLGNDGLGEAERLSRQAVRDCPPDGPARPAVLMSLASVLWQAYSRFGDPTQLDEAIALLREARPLEADPGTDSRLLTTLAAALRARYGRSPDLATLEEAVETARAAIEKATDEEERTGLRANLTVSLVEHYVRTEHFPSLAEAVEIGARVIEETPEAHVAFGHRLSNHGMALSSRFDHTGVPADLEAAIDCHRRAVELTPDGHPDRARRVANLAAAQFKQLAPSGDLDGLRAMAKSAREAVYATPDDNPSRAIRLINLTGALAQLYDYTGDVEHLLEAVSVAELAAGLRTATPFTRLRAARMWGRLAGLADQWEAAAEGFRQGVRLLPLVAPGHLSRADLEYQVLRLDRIASDAACSALWAEDEAGALEVLEEGRGLLLSRALDSRSDLTELRAAHPERAAEWERLTEELDVLTGRAETVLPGDTGNIGDTGDLPGPAPGADHRFRLDERRVELLGKIRATTGFERFLEPPRLAQLRQAAESGPVVTINVSDHRCDALILTTGEPLVVRLTGLHADDLAERVEKFLAALDTVTTGNVVEQAIAQVTLRETLSWLWEVVTEPVLKALGHTGPPAEGEPWPRVWWSPTGLLNFLPLHAAGRFPRDRDEPVPGAAAVLDRVVSSYTPTIRALLHARSRPVAARRRLLAVAIPATPGQAPLPYAREEAEALSRRFDAASPLIDAAASHDNVLAALRFVNWAHFACHAHSDPAGPSNSHLLLHDRPMSVAEVSRLRLEGAELAYLSACSTARGSAELADEAIHIVSAFQLAGYRHVVGSLWPVLDRTSAEVAASFYTGLDGGAPPAEALHAVIRERRADEPLTPSVWAGYVCAGP
ncbi:CHAT domain-containing tetratricopeptide repeat protein [Amycolatopsis nigrescens]|uniref:CHAT domain-containing tetratricopeptide repeat protein n=1 Tax=Amycolatopsis nigrescens TaxID=381445 RepID=UPI00037EAA2C|nr:CHAT domain-containing protein [Amycolatopsis nigrescens]